MGAFTKENPSKRHQLHAGGRILHPRPEAAEESRPIGLWGRMHKTFSARTPARPVQRPASVGKTLDISC